jgi:hypothetical protein
MVWDVDSEMKVTDLAIPPIFRLDAPLIIVNQNLMGCRALQSCRARLAEKRSKSVPGT